MVDDETIATSAITGQQGDKGADAIYLDHDARMVFIIQGKYHQGRSIVTENRSDLIALGDLGRAILQRDSKQFDTASVTASIKAKNALEKARQLIHKRDYRLNLLFVTTGRVSYTHQDEAEQRVEDWDKASFDVCDRADLAHLMQDYIDGVSPPVPTIALPIHGEQMFDRYDHETGISSWVFTMQGKDLGKLYDEIGPSSFMLI